MKTVDSYKCFPILTNRKAICLKHKLWSICNDLKAEVSFFFLKVIVLPEQAVLFDKYGEFGVQIGTEFHLSVQLICTK